MAGCPTTASECRQNDEFMRHSSQPGVGGSNSERLKDRVISAARSMARCPNSGSE
jgi:hypothetical protein